MKGIVVILLALLTACTNVRGYMIDRQDIEDVRIGETTTNDILRTLGRPYNEVKIGLERTWFYMYRVQKGSAVMKDSLMLVFWKGVLKDCRYEELTTGGEHLPVFIDITMCGR